MYSGMEMELIQFGLQIVLISVINFITMILKISIITQSYKIIDVKTPVMSDTNFSKNKCFLQVISLLSLLSKDVFRDANRVKG